MPHTVGILYPGSSAEDDYPALQHQLGDDVSLPVVHTTMVEDAHRVDALLAVGSAEVLAEGGRAARAHGVDAVMWACTSGSFVFGWDGAFDQVKRLREVTGVPTSSTSFAFVHAAEHLGLTRVAVAATYPADVAEHFRAFLGAAGLEVTSLSARGVVTAAEVGQLTGDEVLAFAASNDDPRAEALLMPDTALHTAGCLDALEQHVGKPVLTANQVSAWEGLWLAGYRGGHSGLGLLFRGAQQADDGDGAGWGALA